MNSNSLKRELRIFKQAKKETSLWVPELYKKLKPLFDMFIQEANKYFAEAKTYGLIGTEEKKLFLGYQRFQKKFKIFMDVCLAIINDYHNSTESYFKQAKYKPISERCFHNWKRFLPKLFDKNL